MRYEYLHRIALFVITCAIVFGASYAFCQGLEVDPFDSNYLLWNGERTLLIGETANRLRIINGDSVYDKQARVANFDTSFFKRAKAYGVNHTYVNVADLYENVSDPWALKNVAGNTRYWAKLALIAKTAKQHDMILGVVIFSYSAFYDSGFKNAFQRQYVRNGHPGWFDRQLVNGSYVYGWGFFDLASGDPWIAEGIKIERAIMEQVVKAAWPYAAYICPMWESQAKRALRVRNHSAWHQDFPQRMKMIGNRLYPDVKPPLFAIEAKLTKSQMAAWDYDLFVDEDANCVKVEGVPIIQWSGDGWSRGVYQGWPLKASWNWEDKDQFTGYCSRSDGRCELDYEPTVKFMEWCILNGWAGIASSWGANAIERAELKRLNNKYNQVQPPIKCPVDRHCIDAGCHTHITAK